MTAPLSGMTGPEATAAEQSRMELQARLNGLGGLNGRKLDPEARAKKLREACEGFESIFIQKMWQEMRNAVPKTGILSGREERFWQDMYDQELSKSMTKAGGIGLADMMYEQLSRNLVSASRSAAGFAQGATFTPAAAPLIREESEPEPTQKLAATIYDGEASATGQVAAETETPAAATQASGDKAAVAQAQPVVPPAAPLAAAATAPAAETAAKPERRHVRKADTGQSSGLLMAQKAKREAGDKLGARAVRPGQSRTRERKQAEAQPVQQPVLTGLGQAGELKPGSAEALKAAVEMAKTGAAPAENAAQPLNLSSIVANVQAMNSAQAAQTAVQTAQAPLAAGQTAVAQAEEPVSRKVTFSTNIPRLTNTGSKKTKQAIRMLNVDNAGANSRQGKGLAAYHAQQEAARPAQEAAPVQAAAPLTANSQAPAQAAIPPLTPGNQAETAENSSSFAIPPLTAGEIRS